MHPTATVTPISKHQVVIPLEARGALMGEAELRAEYRLKTPDSIMLATALRAGASLAVTNDAAWKRVRGIDVGLLSELRV